MAITTTRPSPSEDHRGCHASGVGGGAGLGFLQAICEAVEREMRSTHWPTLKGTRSRGGAFQGGPTFRKCGCGGYLGEVWMRRRCVGGR